MGLASCHPPSFRDDDCYRGLAVGAVVELELLEVYERGGAYVFWDMSLPDSYPSCNGVDGLQVGDRIRFELVNRGAASGECSTYWGDLRSTPTGVSPLPQPQNGSGLVVGSQNRYNGMECSEGYWQMLAFRHLSLDDDPFGEAPQPGQLPPLVVRREIAGCGCLDRWVGVIRRIEATDAGAEATDAAR